MNERHALAFPYPSFIDGRPRDNLKMYCKVEDGGAYLIDLAPGTSFTFYDINPMQGALENTVALL